MKKVGIIVAMEEELQPFLDTLPYETLKKIKGLRVYGATFNEHSLVIVQTGIGKVNAALGTTLAIENYQCDVLINFGAVGSLDDNLNIGDVVVIDRFRYHDVDATVFGYELGQVPKMPAYYEVHSWLELKTKAFQQGEIVTSDSFYADQHKIREIKNKFPSAVVLDMEATAIAQVAYYYDVPLVSVKVISDEAGHLANEAFSNNLHFVAEVVRDAVIKLLSLEL